MKLQFLTAMPNGHLVLLRRVFKGLAWAFGVGTVCAVATAAMGKGVFVDVLDTPALTSPLASRSLITAMAQHEGRTVAVGQRGHVLWTDHPNKQWHQARVPVSSDLTSIAFSPKGDAFAVGHDGVLLRSVDAGQSWTLVGDGKSLNTAAQLETVWLDIAATPDGRLLVVGAFGAALQSDDAGAHWTDVTARLPNPEGLHLYGVRSVGEEVFIVGEKGLLLKADAQLKTFTRVPVPYEGTLFGITGDREGLWVYGLRGTVLFSANQGGAWTVIQNPVQSGVVGATVYDAQTTLFISQSGQVLEHRRGQSIAHVSASSAAPGATALLNVKDVGLLASGMRGVSTLGEFKPAASGVQP